MKNQPIIQPMTLFPIKNYIKG